MPFAFRSHKDKIAVTQDKKIPQVRDFFIMNPIARVSEYAGHFFASPATQKIIPATIPRIQIDNILKIDLKQTVMVSIKEALISVCRLHWDGRFPYNRVML